MELSTTGPNKRFEDIKHIDENGVEFWSAREMFPLFGYSTWQAFDDVVARAIKSAVNAGQIAENHFSQLTKMVEVGPNTKRQVKKRQSTKQYLRTIKA